MLVETALHNLAEGETPVKTLRRSIPLLSLIFVSVNPLLAQWVSTNGPGTGGRISSLVVADSMILAGTSESAAGGGSVFLSTDNGASWSPTGLQNTGTITCFAVKLDGAGGVYLFAGDWRCSGNGGSVYRSTDGGTSWIPVLSFGGDTSISSFAEVGNSLFVGTHGAGILRTTDRGTSWAPMNSGLTNLWVRSLAVSGANLFAGTLYGDLFLSTNNGMDWMPTGRNGDVLIALAVSGTNIFASTFYGPDVYMYFVHLSTDNGANWTLRGDFTSQGGVSTFAVSGTNLFAATANSGVFLSIDSGSTWSAVNQGLTHTSVYSLATDGTYLFAGIDSVVWRRPLSEMVKDMLSARNVNFGFAGVGSYEDTTFAITNYSVDTLKITNIVCTTSEFTAWPTSVNIPPGATFKDTIRFRPVRYDTIEARIAISSDGPALDTIIVSGIGVSLDQNVSAFESVFTPTGYVDGNLTATMYVPKKRNGHAVVLVHGLGGIPLNNRIWCDTLAAHGYVTMSINYPDPGVSSSATFPKKTRAAKTAVEFLRMNRARFGIDPNGKIAGWGASLGAQTWAEAIPWDNDDAYFGTDRNIDDHLDAAILLYGRYDRYNNTWWQNYFGNDASKTTKGRLVGNIFKVKTPILFLHGTADASSPYQDAQLVYDSLITYGNKASQLQLFTNEPHAFDVYFQQWDDGYAFRPSGLIAKDFALGFLARILGPTTSVERVSSEMPFRFHLSQNFPNPFNPSTEIQFSVPCKSHVTLAIFDLLGREIATLVSEELSAGSYSTRWDAAGFPSGVYFYKLEADNFVETKKLLLLR